MTKTTFTGLCASRWLDHSRMAIPRSFSGRKARGKQFYVLPRYIVPRTKIRRPVARRSSQATAQTFIAQLGQGGNQCSWLPKIEQKTSIAIRYELVIPRNSAGDHRNPTGHCFKNDIRHPLIK